MENYYWVAGVVAAHPSRQLYGRTRLQKTIKLLQRKGLPTTYRFSNYFYGPFSEALQADVKLLEALDLIKEDTREAADGTVYYVFSVVDQPKLPSIEQFRGEIDAVSRADPVVLEVAATYDAFREQGSDHVEALDQLRRKKGAKCGGGREAAALALLQQIGLQAN